MFTTDRAWYSAPEVWYGAGSLRFNSDSDTIGTNDAACHQPFLYGIKRHRTLRQVDLLGRNSNGEQNKQPSVTPLESNNVEYLQFERDVMVWNHKTYVSRPLLVSEDRTISKHRRWFQQFYSENSPRSQFQKNALDW